MTLKVLQPCDDCSKPEVWRAVPGYEGTYRVSSHGRVLSLARVVMRTNGRPIPTRDRILRPGAWKSGHKFVILADPEHRQDRRGVHRLVLEAFVGPCPPGHECLHHDDCARHNHLANLRWGTRSENFVDRRRTLGKVVPWSKLTPADVRAIRESGLTQQALADQYGVRQATISKVVNGRTHRDV